MSPMMRLLYVEMGLNRVVHGRSPGATWRASGVTAAGVRAKAAVLRVGECAAAAHEALRAHAPCQAGRTRVVTVTE